MWYYMTKYSFDPEKNVVGPFGTEKEAWSEMEKCANEEYRIDTEENCWNEKENGWSTEIVRNETCGEITIKNFFISGVDVTEFFIFEIE